MKPDVGDEGEGGEEKLNERSLKIPALCRRERGEERMMKCVKTEALPHVIECEASLKINASTRFYNTESSRTNHHFIFMVWGRKHYSNTLSFEKCQPPQHIQIMYRSLNCNMIILKTGSQYDIPTSDKHNALQCIHQTNALQSTLPYA